MQFLTFQKVIVYRFITNGGVKYVAMQARLRFGMLARHFSVFLFWKNKKDWTNLSTAFVVWNFILRQMWETVVCSDFYDVHITWPSSPDISIQIFYWSQNEQFKKQRIQPFGYLKKTLNVFHMTLYILLRLFDINRWQKNIPYTEIVDKSRTFWTGVLVFKLFVQAYRTINSVGMELCFL